MTVDFTARFAALSTPLIADASLRLRVPVRCAQVGIRALREGWRVSGIAVPVRHYGSVDIFIEAIGTAPAGSVLVIDNGGRMDEGCIGDLITLEAMAAGMSGMVVWGAHRDTKELLEIDFPVFSYGTMPVGPQRLDPRDPDPFSRVQFGGCEVQAGDVVFADEDGVMFVARADIDAVLNTADIIQATEREQARLVKAGTRLHEQLRFDEYLTRRAHDPFYTFRVHLSNTGGAVEA